MYSKMEIIICKYSTSRFGLYVSNTYIGQTPKRRALLFIDNASTHGTPTLQDILLHTRVEFFPKNTTPLLQPLDLGVMSCVKRRYKHRIAQRAVYLQ